jgi:hypothetical protein
MKSILRPLMAVVMLCAFAVVAGCGATLHKPTTAGNAGTSALVAYAVAGFTAGQYLKLPVCAATPVYPCKTQAVNDRLVAADLAAYSAAVAADHAGNASLAQPQIDALKAATAAPDVQAQIAGGGK